MADDGDESRSDEPRTDEPPKDDAAAPEVSAAIASSGGRRVAAWVAAVLAVLTIAVLAWLVRDGCASTQEVIADAAETGELATLETATPTHAVVRGVVVLERIDETALEGEMSDTTSTGGDEGTDTGDAPPDAPPPTAVETFAPTAGTCRITARQRGTPVADATSCDDTGAFELALHPGTTGIVAFELEVPGRLRAVVEVEVPPEGIGRLPQVALGVGQTVAGMVTDGRGAPVGSIEIQARPVPDLGEPEPWRTTSAADGTFTFDTLPPGPIVLRVVSERHAESVLEVIAPESEVELVASALYDFSGDIVGPVDVLARTVVRIEGSGVWPVRETPLVGGTFVFARIPDGVYALQAVAAAARPGEAEYASIPLENVSPDARVTLALARAQRVPVHVTDPDGTPVVGARVTLGSAHLGLLQQRERTDTDGRVAVGPVPAGAYVIRVDADGFLGAEPVALDVADEAVETIEVRLVRPGRIAGIVVDDEDRAVAEASIEVRSDAAFSIGEQRVRSAIFERAVLASGSLGVTRGPVPEIPLGPSEPAAERGDVSSDADGRFVLGELAPGTYTLQAWHGRWAASDTVEIRVRPGQMIEGVRLQLRQGELLTGRVVDGNARPLADAWIELADGSAYGTDARGVFSAGRRRGSQVIVARAPGKAASRITAVVRDAPVDVEITLHDAEATVRGHVNDDNARPLAGVQVTLRGLDELVPTDAVWTDARGQFAFEWLPVGPVELGFDSPDHAPLTVRAEATEHGRARPLEIVLRSGWRLRVDVRDRNDGTAIADAIVTAAGQRGRTDIRGVVELAALAEDTVLVAIEADGYGMVRREVERDGDRTDMIVELAQGGMLEGIVTDWRGDPVAGAAVRVRVGDEVVAELHTSARGRFRAGGIPEGDVVLEARPPADREDDLASVSQRTDVLRGRTTRGIDLRFERR